MIERHPPLLRMSNKKEIEKTENPCWVVVACWWRKQTLRMGETLQKIYTCETRDHYSIQKGRFVRNIFWHSRLEALARLLSALCCPSGLLQAHCLLPSPLLRFKFAQCKTSQVAVAKSMSFPFRDACAFTAEVIHYLSLIRQNLSVCVKEIYTFISYEFELLPFTNPQH